MNEHAPPDSGPPEAARPRAVTIIGRTWLVAGTLLFLVALVDLVVWIVLKPAMPTILGFASRKDPSVQFLAPYLEHYTLVKTIEVFFGAAVAVSAFHFLRMRAWARAALEAASWVYLVYLVAFFGFSYTIMRRAWLDRATIATHPIARERLVGGAGLGILLVAALVLAIVRLRGRRMRAAFEEAAVR
ncbi:MAG TPA: hypothetical protein VKH43_11715 [Thermoanaerobaculia bacterium]|nr:hypothetical protein [Thermoanaerobaculia bacterium]